MDYSYTFGIYPTIDLLKKRPEIARTVIVHPKIYENHASKEIFELCDKHNIRIDTGSRVINKIAYKENTYAVGVFSKFESRLEENKNHVLLASPMNMGNVGTIIRTMDGFETYNLGIIRPAVDIFDPTIVRSAMGALFDVNFEYFDSFEEYKLKYESNIVYPFVLNGKNSLKEIKFDHPTTLLFGNEGHGLSKDFEEFDTSVTINHSKKIDSLNLSMSVGIALFQLYNN